MKKGVPFRTAYKITGRIVAYCIAKDKTMEEMSLEEYKEFCDLFDDGIYDAVNIKNCVQRRRSYGGPARGETLRAIESLKAYL